MTTAILSEQVDRPRPAARVGVPRLAAWTVPRLRLADRLDRGATGLITQVVAPSGSGKTIGVASWAATTTFPGAVIWVSASDAATDPDLFWALVRDGLIEAGAHDLPVIPASRTPQLHRRGALARVGTALGRGGPWLLVLDDFPTGEVRGLGRDLQRVVEHARRRLSITVISHGSPALPVQRHQVAGDLTRVASPDLAMDHHEVAAVLTRHDVDADEFTARTVQRHTAGWACGVQLVARAMREAPTLEAAIEEADRATVDYLAAEVLAASPAGVRELIIRTSVVERVDPGLAWTVLGFPGVAPFPREVLDQALLDVDTDGSFRCHPLLRVAAARALADEAPGVGRQARLRAAQWHIDQGRTGDGLDVLAAAQDWASMGRSLVDTFAVPRILAGSVDHATASALDIGAVRGAEPVLEAALLLAQGTPDAAAAVLDLAAEDGTDAADGVAERLSAVFVRLAVARARGDVYAGLPLAAAARDLMVHLHVDRQRELSGFVAAHVGALELCAGDLEQAQVTLQQGVLRASGGDSPGTAPIDCLGQLALLEAFRGDLCAAKRRADAVLGIVGDTPRAGVAHAHLAIGWVHLERDEHAPATQHLDRARSLTNDASEPWYDTVELLARARLLEVAGRPEAALRLLAPARHASTETDQPVWTRDLVVHATVDALLLTGEPLCASDPLARARTTSVETGLLVARVRAGAGDLEGVGTALATVAAELPAAPLATQIEYWLLEARSVAGAQRAHVLVDRALHEASREQMRRPIVPLLDWLSQVVGSDPGLRRSHSGFLAGCRSSIHGSLSRPAATETGLTQFVETLTAREAQVLGLLAEMCSTEEIASELFLSVNTVKTYVRGILRKLGVNRRVDAVRRGRGLGLC